MIERFDLSERRACRLVGLTRDSYRHPPVPDQMTVALGAAIIDIAQARRRFGYATQLDDRPHCTTRAGGKRGNSQNARHQDFRFDLGSRRLGDQVRPRKSAFAKRERPEWVGSGRWPEKTQRPLAVFNGL
jgi:hypothetical protein